VTRKLPLFAVSLAVLLAFLGLANPFSRLVTAQQPTKGLAPRFVVDPFWPKPLPNRWLLGQVAGVAVDAQDHVWIVQRPRTLSEDEKGATLALHDGGRQRQARAEVPGALTPCSRTRSTRRRKA